MITLAAIFVGSVVAFSALGSGRRRRGAPLSEGRKTPRFVHIGTEEEMVGIYQVLLIPTVPFFGAGGNDGFRRVGHLTPGQPEAELRKAGPPGAPAEG